MPNKRKIPLRMCVGCREMKPKKELLRVVRAPEDAGGAVSLDLRGKAPGRGAYVCPDPACLKKAQKSRQLERALETAIAPEVYDRLEAQIAEHQKELEKLAALAGREG